MHFEEALINFASRQAVALLLLAAWGCVAACGGAPDSVLVLAAASTIDAMEAAAREFNSDGGAVEVSFGPTSVLARQIEEGAPADMMLAASAEWGTYVAQRVRVEESVVLLGNRLALVAREGTAAAAARTMEQVVRDPAITRIAIADPTSVPVGIYAAQALRSAGLWQLAEPRLIPTRDARAALALVADGETEAGLVYATDAAAHDAVSIVTTIDPALHEPIEYPLLLLGDGRPGARRFYEFLRSARGRAHFLQRGFSEPPAGGSDRGPRPVATTGDRLEGTTAWVRAIGRRRRAWN